MCGIFGYRGFNLDSSAILLMIQSIYHRGPDDNGFLQDQDIVLGMTRLSIIDIVGGHQPIFSENKRYAIVFNGEIYNYRELQKHIRSQGKNVHTHSDTEVILSLYEIYGQECLSHLRGMFAFSIFDFQSRELFIARDRIGIKPLYYWKEGSKFAFASEIKALLKLPDIQRTLAPHLSGVKRYLKFRYSPGPETMFSGIFKFPEAHWMKIDKNGHIKIERYWAPRSTMPPIVSLPEALENYRETFDESIQLRLISEVPIGAYLSGGVDSTSIVESMVRQSLGVVKTFTVGFDWEKDELDQARATSKILGTDHHEIICTSRHLSQLPRIIEHCDEPLGDPIVVPTFLLAEEARKHVTVVLSGEGADEIFGGYAFHKILRMVARYRKMVPHRVHQHVISPLISTIPAGMMNPFFDYPAYLGNKGKEKLVCFVKDMNQQSYRHNFYDLISLFTDDEKKDVYTENFYQQVEEKLPLYDPGDGTLQDFIDMQFEHWLPDNMLMRQDKTSMAHGLEVRVPFLDHKMIEYAYRLPDSMKIGKGVNKRILRDALAQRIKGYNSYQKKTPFYFPFENLYNSKEFKELVSTYLNDRAVIKRGYFRPEAIRTLLSQMEHKNFLAAKQIFSLLSLEIWNDIYFK